MRLAIVSDLAIWRPRGRVLAAPPGDVMEINALAGLSDRVRLIGLAGKNSTPPHAVELDPRVEVVTAPIRGGRGVRGKLRALGGCWEAGEALDETLKSADLVHLRCPSKLAWAALARLATRLERPRIWARWGGEWQRWEGEPISYRLQRLALAAGARAVCTTPVGAAGLPNPTRTAAQLARAERRTEAKRLDLPLRLLFTARLTPDKGGDTVRAAADQLARRGWPLRVDVAGDGEDRSRLQAKARRLGLEQSVVFHGWLASEALDDLAAEAHFVLLPSRTEGFPRALHEAMAYRTVPLASPAGAVPQTLARIDPQLLAPADEPAVWTERIERIAARPDIWRRLADASRREAAACSAEAYREAVLNLLESQWGLERRAATWEAAQ